MIRPEQFRNLLTRLRLLESRPAAAPGSGDAATTGTLDQFADVSQTGGATLTIGASTTLSGGTHSGNNTGDQDLSGYATAATLSSHTGNTSNPHSVTKTQVGLSNVENTAISTWTGSANITTLGTIGTGTWQGTAIGDTWISSAATWNAKQAALVSGTNIKTINGTTILGSGDLTVSGGSSPVVYVGTTSNVEINSVSDVTIVTRDVTSVGTTDKITVEAEFVILNNSTATRVCVITLDFDGLFDVEFSTGALAFSATLMHPFFLRATLDIRSASLAYGIFTCEGQLAAGIASGTDTTMAATHLRGMGWATTASDASGTCTVALKIRSASAVATQTCRLHNFVVSKYTPT